MTSVGLQFVRMGPYYEFLLSPCYTENIICLQFIEKWFFSLLQVKPSPHPHFKYLIYISDYTTCALKHYILEK